MPVKCQQIISWIEELAPKKLAEDWDNVGLQLGSYNTDISNVLVSLDINLQVADEAIHHGAELIVSHHPFIFQPIKQLRSDLPQGKVLTRLIQAGTGIYIAHTNWDCAEEGVSRILAAKLELAECEPLKVTRTEKLFKIVVFVPRGYEDKVREGLSKGGAGFIGNYSNCTFQVDGIGTFKAEEGTNPFIGEQGNLEKVAEYRLETIVPETKLRVAVNTMLREHPYEEVAYDIFPLKNKGKLFGIGLTGKLPDSVDLGMLVEKVKKFLNLKTVKVTGDLSSTVRKVAVCGGSGGDLINTALIKGAEVLITGDVGYHQAQEALNLGIAVIDAGHYATEILSMETLSEYLKQKAGVEKKNLTVLLSQVNTDPWRYL